MLLLSVLLVVAIAWCAVTDRPWPAFALLLLLAVLWLAHPVGVEWGWS